MTSSIVCLTTELSLQVKDFLCISDNAFIREEVLSKEKSILNKLQWNAFDSVMHDSCFSVFNAAGEHDILLR